jgi:hypothetical protein
MILVFGILGLVQCPIFGILAWIMGTSDLKAIDAGLMDRAGREHTNTGRILGMIACIIQMVAVGTICLIYGCLALGLIGAAGAGAAGGGGGGGY